MAAAAQAAAEAGAPASLKLMHSKSQLNIRSPVTASSDRKETETGEFLSSSSFSDRKTVMLSDKKIGPPLVRSALLLRCCAVALLRRRGTAQAADTLASPSAVTRKNARIRLCDTKLSSEDETSCSRSIYFMTVYPYVAELKRSN